MAVTYKNNPSDFKALKDGMVRKSTPFWTVVTADTKSIVCDTNRSISVIRENDEAGNDCSFQILKTTLQRVAYGNQVNIKFFEKDNGTTPQWSAVFFNDVPMMQNQNVPPQYAGISGHYMSGAFDFDKVLEKEKKMWELEKQVESLVNAKQPDYSRTDRILERILDDEQLVPMVGGLFSQGIALLEAVLAGQKNKHNQSNMNGNHYTTPPPRPQPNDGDNGEEEYDGEKLTNACDIIGDLIPDQTPEDVIYKLSIFLKNNPSYVQIIKAQI